MKKFLQEFKAFALKGNVMDMAVGVIIGGAFTAIVTSLSDNFIKPILYLFTGAPEGYEAMTVPQYAMTFVTAVVNFIITALVLFLLIKGINKLSSVGKKPEPKAAPTTKKCPFCCSEIPLAATRCPHCTSEIEK